LIDHNISSRGKESVALDDKWKKAIRHDGLPKGDGQSPSHSGARIISANHYHSLPLIGKIVFADVR
jgi:hypothetical protein